MQVSREAGARQLQGYGRGQQQTHAAHGRRTKERLHLRESMAASWPRVKAIHVRGLRALDLPGVWPQIRNVQQLSELHFDNSFVRALPADPIAGNKPRQVLEAAYSRVSPTPVA